MSIARRDLSRKLLLAWFAHGLDPEPEFQIAPTDPHVVCRKCWRPKPPEEFNGYRNRAGEFVPATICKACHKALVDLPRRARLRAAAAVRRAQRLGKCNRCGGRALVSYIYAHSRNCPDCVAALAKQSDDRAAFLAAHGGKDPWRTPEYHRLLREREADRLGRSLPAYTPQAERERLAPLKRAERSADRHRKKVFQSLVREYDWLAGQSQEVTQAERQEHAAYQRQRYARRRREEIDRHLNWKTANPERISEYGRTRAEREREGADGTVTRETVMRLKRLATRCAYCDSPLVRKETDHMMPVCLGGEHSLRNIVIACPLCNGRKAKLTYAQWTDRIEPEHRARVVALWMARFGELETAGAPVFLLCGGFQAEGVRPQ